MLTFYILLKINLAFSTTKTKLYEYTSTFRPKNQPYRLLGKTVKTEVAKGV